MGEEDDFIAHGAELVWLATNLRGEGAGFLLHWGRALCLAFGEGARFLGVGLW